MTDIRASGFDSKHDLQQHLDEVEAERLAEAHEGVENRDVRSAQLELSWLRREASQLRESLRIASGATASSGARQSIWQGPFARAVIPVAAGIVALTLIGRKRDRIF